VPASQSLIYTFDANANNRANQDVGGLDGLANANEGAVYSTSLLIQIQRQMIIRII
jgi:hypothetical protein